MYHSSWEFLLNNLSCSSEDFQMATIRICYKQIWKITTTNIIGYSYIKDFGLVWFYGISTIVGYLMPNPFYTNIYDLVWLGFMAYQSL